MAMTRKQLKEAGILLNGPVVPDWFKRRSDGCSVPRPLKHVLLSHLWRARCTIHDYEYYLTAILYWPSRTDKRFDESRWAADKNLRDNIALCSKFAALSPMFVALFAMRTFLSRIYYRGVRIGGGVAIKTRITDLAVPHSVEAVDTVRQDALAHAGERLTLRAEKIFSMWKQQLQGDES